MGYQGDPVLEDPNFQRPAWTKDGSLMTFRKLEQDVPGFNDYIKQNGCKWRQFVKNPKEIVPPLTDQEGEELFAARLVGRWKSVSVSRDLVYC